MNTLMNAALPAQRGTSGPSPGRRRTQRPEGDRLEAESLQGDADAQAAQKLELACKLKYG
jgi:hypothetical protein